MSRRGRLANRITFWGLHSRHTLPSRGFLCVVEHLLRRRWAADHVRLSKTKTMPNSAASTRTWLQGYLTAYRGRNCRYCVPRSRFRANAANELGEHPGWSRQRARGTRDLLSISGLIEFYK